jgi:hypothetical protein
MAKNSEPAPETAEAAPAAAPASTDDGRAIMLNIPEGHPVTQLGGAPAGTDVAEGTPLALSAGSHPRAAFIRALARTGEWERGAIAKECTKLQFTEEQIKAGKKVPYQIVFQATSKIPNVKKSDRQVGTAAASGEASPADAGTSVPAE